MPHEWELDEDWMEVTVFCLFIYFFFTILLVKGRQHNVVIQSELWDSSI